jgi:hypothetical protein
MGQDQELMKVAGDLLFKAADFPMAQDVAERIRRTIPAAVLGDGPSPQEQDMQQKMKHMGEMIEHLSQALQQAQQGKESARHEHQGIRRGDAPHGRARPAARPASGGAPGNASRHADDADRITAR